MTRTACLPLLLTTLAAVSACVEAPLPPIAPPPIVTKEQPSKGSAWVRIATAEDLGRVNRLSEAWSAGLREARAGRFARMVRDEGRLLEADAAQPRPAPTPGSYHCRLVRLGKADPKSPAFAAFKPFFCYVDVEGDLLTFVKQTGSERPAGRLWDDDEPDRLIFLGSVARGEREQPVAYSEDRSRDLAGVLERIAPMRWRLVLPFPSSGAKLDLYELTPVAEQPKG